MFCPKCGEEIKDGSKFCKHCGSQIKSNAGGGTAPKPINTSNDDGDRNKKIIIAVLIAAIVILAVVFVGFGTGLFSNDSQNANGASQSQPSSSTPTSSAPGSSAPSSPAVSLSSFPVSQSPALAQAIRNSGGNFPVSFQSLSLSKAQCLYILTKSISEISILSLTTTTGPFPTSTLSLSASIQHKL